MNDLVWRLMECLSKEINSMCRTSDGQGQLGVSTKISKPLSNSIHRVCRAADERQKHRGFTMYLPIPSSHFENPGASVQRAGALMNDMNTVGFTGPLSKERTVLVGPDRITLGGGRSFGCVQVPPRLHRAGVGAWRAAPAARSIIHPLVGGGDQANLKLNGSQQYGVMQYSFRAVQGDCFYQKYQMGCEVR